MSEAALRENIEAQLDRLLSQLEDLDTLKGDLSDDEIQREKQDTLAQLAEFQDSLKKSVTGNMTLQSEYDAARVAIRAAVSEAFKTPEVIRLFARKQPAALRRRLEEIDRDVKLGKIETGCVADQVVEILTALKKLGDPLAPKEERFLQQHRSEKMSEFEAIEENDAVEVSLAAYTKAQDDQTNRIDGRSTRDVQEYLDIDHAWYSSMVIAKPRERRELF
eukprot:CAMPEP_0119320442 /NCGR_PEP_ID=MMETSP1333-20130426/52462_1 /TAXON_ID=418940 /ORGANISM="Scyphosphaera apsteinii, Strain RCC1455" /LENGTH=219 /DNA_ID=CAMNT_0007327163 /DNA_START=46 /DNA_END=706 /DNA_ORIENTATION=-